MKNELIDRYVYAVVRHLPLKLRADVEKELDSLISDMLEARCGAVLPTEKDIRVVLTELGPPEELAAKYSGDEAQALISGSYFLLYKLVLKIVLPIALVGIAFASILSLFADGGLAERNPYMLLGKIIGQAVGGAVGGTMQAFAIITFVFAILERKKVTFDDGDFFARLPTVPKAEERIKIHEPIMGIAWCVLAAAVLLGFPQVIGAWNKSVGWVPLLATQVVRSLWLPILLWFALGVVKEVVKLVDGRYTLRVGIVTGSANLLTIACVAVVFLQSRILNPAFLKHIDQFLVGEGGAEIAPLFAKINLLFLCIVLFALVLDTVTVAVKVRKHNR